MRVLLVFFVVCLLATTVVGQQTSRISGLVMTRDQPVPNATVSLRSEQGELVSTKVDANGRYVFENLKEGRYTISASLGTSEASREIEVGSGQQLTIDLDLVLDLRREYNAGIREHVTIAADAGQPIDAVSKTVNVISGQEMRERADFTLVDTLRTIPGLRVQQLGGFGRTASIKTRGLRNQDTAVLIDGIRFRDAAAITGDASPFLSDFTLTSVSRVEVLRGSGSSLYGTNAIGGVIDFQTPVAQNAWHGQVSGAAGGLGLGRFRGNVSKTFGPLGFNVGVSRTVYTKGIDGEDDARNTNFQSRLDYQPTSKANLSGRFFVSNAFVRLNSNPDTFGTPPISNFGIFDAEPGVNFAPDANDADDFQKSRFFNGQLVFTQIFGPNLFLQAYYSGLKTSRRNETGPLGIGFQSSSTSLFDGLIQTASARVDWSPGKRNKLTVGYEFEHEKFGNDAGMPEGTGDFFTRAYQSSNTVYAQELVSLLKGRLNLAGGFRVQQFNLNDPKFSAANAPYSGLTLKSPPNAYTFDGAASYYFEKSGTKIRAHAGNGYRVPSLFERFGTFFNTFTFPAPPRFEALGDPNLKPERSIAFDGGVEQKLFGEKARLTAVYFYTRLIDTIGFGNEVPGIGSTPRSFGGYENQKGGIARGGEFGLNAKPTRATDIFVSYTYTNSDQREPQVEHSGVITSLGIPAHQFTAVITQRIKGFWASLDLLATSSYLGQIFSSFRVKSYVYRFDGNRRADVTTGYTFRFSRDPLNLRVFATVENLFDDEYYESGFRTVGRNGRVGVSFSF